MRATARDELLHWLRRLPRAAWRKYHVYPLDIGAVWGRRLTALQLEDTPLFAVQPGFAAPLD